MLDSQPSLNSEPQVPLKEMNGIFEGDTGCPLVYTHQVHTPTHAYTQVHAHPTKIYTYTCLHTNT